MLDLPLETSIGTMNLSKSYNTPDQQDHLVENLDLGVNHDKRILLISIVSFDIDIWDIPLPPSIPTLILSPSLAFCIIRLTLAPDPLIN